MITLTRLSGSVFVLNSDLIERIDSTPDSVVTLMDGKKYVVCESLEEIVAAVREYRSQVVAFGAQLVDRAPMQDAPSGSDDAEPEPAHERPNLVALSQPRGDR